MGHLIKAHKGGADNCLIHCKKQLHSEQNICTAVCSKPQNIPMDIFLAR